VVEDVEAVNPRRGGRLLLRSEMLAAYGVRVSDRAGRHVVGRHVVGRHVVGRHVGLPLQGRGMV
jgi:hypothetical protein